MISSSDSNEPRTEDNVLAVQAMMEYDCDELKNLQKKRLRVMTSYLLLQRMPPEEILDDQNHQQRLKGTKNKAEALGRTIVDVRIGQGREGEMEQRAGAGKYMQTRECFYCTLRGMAPSNHLFIHILVAGSWSRLHAESCSHSSILRRYSRNARILGKLLSIHESSVISTSLCFHPSP
jgi:hypothetical protein